jgi:hypothetical protein
MVRLTSISSITIGIVAFCNTTAGSHGPLISAAIAETVLAIVLMTAYFFVGITIYRYQVPRLFIFFIISTFLAVTISTCLDAIAVIRDGASKLQLYLPLLFISVNYWAFASL